MMTVSLQGLTKAKHYLNSGLRKREDCPSMSVSSKYTQSHPNLWQGFARGMLTIQLLLVASSAHSRSSLPSPVSSFVSNPSPSLSSSQPLRVATRFIKPDMFEEKGQIVGFSAELANSILEQLQRKAILKTYPTIPEILDAIRLNQADLGIAAIAITSQREQEFDFSHPILSGGLQIMVLTPTEQAKQIEGEVWQRMLEPSLRRLLGIVVLLMLLESHILWFYERQNKEGLISNATYIPGIFQALWWTILALLGQAEGMPKGPVGKLVGLLWILIGIIFVAYFTAVITSELTVQELQGNIHGLNDLQNRPVAIIADREAVNYLQDQNMKQIIEFTQDEPAYQALLTGKVDALIAPSPLLHFYAAHQGKGKVQIVGTPFLNRFYAIVMPKDSSYRKPINQAILTLKENGTYEKIYQNWFGVRPDH